MGYSNVAVIVSFLLLLVFNKTSLLSGKHGLPDFGNQEEKVWARRSVLDKIPRILSMRLHKNVYAAYNTESATIYKVWAGTINYDGSVYNGVHGFQPTSQGTTLLQENERDLWQIKTHGKTLKPLVSYKGHRLLNGEITLSYDLAFGSRHILIEEKPSIFTIGRDTSVTGFQRKFKVIGGDNSTVVLLNSAKGVLKSDSDFNVDGQTVTGVLQPGNRDFTVEIKSNATTILSWKFQIASEPRKKVVVRKEEVLTMLEKSDCYSCHHKDVKTVGPSFSEISARYKGVGEEFTNRLALKIINGGAGNWGSTLMSPHPDLSFADATTFVNYILSVEPKKKTPSPKIPVIAKDTVPGDGFPLKAVHPSFDLSQARPGWFKPRIGGMDFLPDGRLAISTWDSLGAVYLLDGIAGNDPEKIKIKRIASGLQEPLGLKVVDGQIYIMQKQELTRLVDLDGDEIIDEYQTVCNQWKVSDNFHEFAFGLVYKEGYFYCTLATDINNGGTSTDPQIPDRGKVIRVSKNDGSMTFLATGLRTPNGIGIGPDDQMFIADNQGDWLPSNKIIHLQKNAWYGSRAVDFEGTKNRKPTPPALWLPQGDIANSPSQPVLFNKGIYQNQLLFGDVSYGGIQRGFLEKVNGVYQGAVFKFSQGLEAGINRLVWAADGSLYAGGVGLNWSWGQTGKLLYGLQHLTFNGKSTFEMLAVRIKPDGLEIELTEPLKSGQGLKPTDYEISQWWYLPTKDYGGPKMNEEILTPTFIRISADRKRLFLRLPGVKPDHVVYIKLNRKTMTSESGSNLWSTEAWYTVNKIPNATKTSSKIVSQEK
jgi:cytochrome c551/c552